MDRIDIMNMYAKRADTALKEGSFVQPVRKILPDCSIQEAYNIQFQNEQARLADGWRLAGYKVGVTTAAAQKKMNVAQPVLGLLYQELVYPDGEIIPYAPLNKPVLEVEIAIRAKKDVVEPIHSLQDALDHISDACIAFEIASGRLQEGAADAAELIADGTAARAIVLGSEMVPVLNDHMLKEEVVELFLENNSVEKAGTDAVLGDPLLGFIWLANMLLAQGRQLRKNEFVMTGSMTAAVPITCGTTFRAVSKSLGSVNTQFH